MPAYAYLYRIKGYGRGQGVVFAKTKVKAKRMVMVSPFFQSHSDCTRVHLTLLSVKKEQLVDFSWEE